MLSANYDPNSPVIDPELQAAIEKWRQQQAQEAAKSQKEDVGTGLPAIGKGFINLLSGIKQHYDLQQQNQTQSALASALGGQAIPATPFLGGAGSGAGVSMAPALSGGMPGGMAGGGVGQVDPTFDPMSKGAGLQPHLADYAQDTLQDAADQGVNAHIISGYRSPEQQAQLVAGGSYAAQPGQSRHQYGAAFDYQPDNPSPAAYNTVNDAARNLGLTAGADFQRPDIDHIQLPGSLADAKASQAASLGSVPPNAMASALGGSTPAAQTFAPHQGARGLVSAADFNNSLIQKGLSPAAAAGLTGNATWESGAPRGHVYLDPATDANVKNFGTGDAAVGSIQWEGPRKAGVGPTLDSQTQHIVDELKAGNQGLSLGELNAVTDPSKAAALVNSKYERPLSPGSSMAQRQAYARDVYGATAGNAPSSFGVPPGQTAGPGVPSDIAPTTPEGRAAALGVPTPPPRPIPTILPNQTPPVPPAQVAGGDAPMQLGPQSPVAIAPQPMGPSPSSVNPALSPNLMGPASGFSPSPGAGPGAAGVPLPAAPPPTPMPQQAPPRPMAAPSGGQTGSAYDPATGRFLAPGEQIPGYAPAPMSSTGGRGPLDGIGNLLSSLFGGGTAQTQSPLAKALGGGTPGSAATLPLSSAQQSSPGAISVPAQPVPAATPSVSGATQPVSGAQPGQPGGQSSGNPLLGQVQRAYELHDQNYRQLQQKANALVGTPFQASVQAQANAEREERDKLQQTGLAMQQEELKTAQDRAAKTVRPMTAEEAKLHGVDAGDYMVNNATGMISHIEGKKEETTWGLPTPEQAAQLPNGGKGLQVSSKGELKAIPSGEGPKPEVTTVNDAMGNPIHGIVKSDGSFAPLKIEGAQPAAPGGGGPVSEEGMEQAPKEAALPGTTAPPNPSKITPAEQARMDAIPGLTDGYKNQLTSILNGDQTPPTRTTSPRGEALMQNLQAVRPGFSAAQAASQVGVRKDFSSGQTGKLITSANALLDHTAKLQDASEDYGKGFGTAADKFLYDKLGIAPFGASARENTLKEQADTTALEATKFLTASPQGGGETERLARAARLGDPSLPPEARMGAAKELVEDSLQRLIETQARWHAGFQGQPVGDYPILSPNAIANAKKLGFGDWFDKNDKLVGPGKGVLPQDYGAGTYAPGTAVVPGSSVGNTPSNTPGMLSGEQDSRAPYLIGGTALGAAGLGAALAGAPVAGRMALGAAGAGPSLAKGLAGKMVGKGDVGAITKGDLRATAITEIAKRLLGM